MYTVHLNSYFRVLDELSITTTEYVAKVLESELFSFPGIYFSVRLSTGRCIVHFNFRAGPTFPVPVCTVPHGHWVYKADTSRCNKFDAVRLYALFRLNLLLPNSNENEK